VAGGVGKAQAATVVAQTRAETGDGWRVWAPSVAAACRRRVARRQREHRWRWLTAWAAATFIYA